MPKPRRAPLAGAILPLLLSVGLAAPAVAEDQKAGVTTERVVVDAMTGFAIGGFDPVAYFEQGRPVEGRDGFEANWDGAIWRFANAGDRDAFTDSPDLYAPQFGGHCVTSAAKGVPAEGDPEIFIIAGGRLYLFRGEEERREWLAAPDALVAAAVANWPKIRAMLPE